VHHGELRDGVNLQQGPFSVCTLAHTAAKKIAALRQGFRLPPGKRLNGIQPRYAPAVGNYLPYVCHRTVHLGRKSYKCTVDGLSQFGLNLCWPGKTGAGLKKAGMRFAFVVKLKEHQHCGRRCTHSRLMYAMDSLN
jgi:hypothetical protein